MILAATCGSEHNTGIIETEFMSMYVYQRCWLMLFALLTGGLLGACAAIPSSLPSTAVPQTTFPVAAPLAPPSPTGVPQPLVDGRRAVDIGGYALAINCTGKGTPTVVLESRLGANGSEWDTVQSKIMEVTRVCSFSRAGRGQSDASPYPRTSSQMAKELHTLLTNAGEVGPYILVGTSITAWNTRLFASTYSDSTAGIVLADATPPEIIERWKALLPVESKDLPLGVARIWSVINRPASKTPEGMDIATSSDQARAAATLGQIPVIVLTHTQPDINALTPQIGDTPRGELSNNGVADFPPELLAQLEQVWQQLQQEQAQISSEGQLVAVESSHFMTGGKGAKAIIAAVQSLIEQSP